LEGNSFEVVIWVSGRLFSEQRRRDSANSSVRPDKVKNCIIIPPKNLDMLDRMETQARLALGTNPDTDQQRDLEAQLLDYAGRKAVVEERIKLIESKWEAAPLPSQDAIDKVATLLEKVEIATRDAVRADSAIKLGTEVLELAGELVA
jgi:hypothetical protein